MRTEFQHVLESYSSALRENFADHPVAQYVRKDLTEAVRAILHKNGETALDVRGSAGQSKWADIPWVAVMDPVVTDTPEAGYYLAYLFNCSTKRVVLSLLIGTTAVRKEFGINEGRGELQRLVKLIRLRAPEYKEGFSDAPIDLSTSSGTSRAASYEMAHAFGVTYDSLPDEDVLAAHLGQMARLSRFLTYRGGLDFQPPAIEEGPAFSAEEGGKKYYLHLRIERSRTLAKKAKSIHGYICQACGFDFHQVYGDVGQKYIEAHHLIPLSELAEGTPAQVDAKNDFAVLCANCHRMIHRPGAPRQLKDFRAILAKPGGELKQ